MFWCALLGVQCECCKCGVPRCSTDRGYCLNVMEVLLEENCIVEILCCNAGAAEGSSLRGRGAVSKGDLLPLALQPTVGFGLSNNVLPFFPICHQLSPSSHFQHLKISFYFLFPPFPGSSLSSRPFQFFSEDLFWASYPPPFYLGDLTSLSFALLSISSCFLLYSSPLVLYSSHFSIPRFHI